MLQQELINFEGRERNLLGWSNVIATAVAGPSDVTGAAVVASLVVAASVRASATVVARAAVIFGRSSLNLIRIRSIVRNC